MAYVHFFTICHPLHYNITPSPQLCGLLMLVSWTFIGASYYGIVNADTVTPIESEIKALDKVLKSSRKFLYQDITTDWGKVCYAYPASLGLLTNIKDNKNNFNYTDSFT